MNGANCHINIKSIGILDIQKLFLPSTNNYSFTKNIEQFAKGITFPSVKSQYYE